MYQFQQGGQPQPQGDPAAGGGQDLAAMIQQAAQTQDAQLALQIVTMLAQQMGAQGQAPATQPKFKLGGKPKPRPVTDKGADAMNKVLQKRKQ